jgi:hypothetical protein
VPAGVDLGVLLLGLMAVIGVGIVMISQARSPKDSA